MGPVSRRDFLKGSATVAGAALWTGSGLAMAAGEPVAEQFQDGAPPMPEKGRFSVIVLPDTQNYSEKFPQTFDAQTEWVVAQKADRRIAAVLHLGDITNRSTRPEWENARRSMHKLNGHVPYTMATGNHDYSEGGACKDRQTLFNDYFPLAGLRETSGLASVYDREPERAENACYLFEAGDHKFGVLSLEFGPRKDVVRWANETAEKHRDRSLFLVTHAYMFSDETRYDWKKYGAKQTWNPHAYAVAKATGDDVSDGEELWTNLVSRHENFIMTLNGHVLNDGLAQTVTATPGGREIPQVLVNFQMKPKGGNGWLRILDFAEDAKSVKVYDYSPTLDKTNVTPANRFDLTLPG